MKPMRTVLLLLGTLLSLNAWCKPWENWPKTISSNNGTIIKIYQPEPESFSDNVLKARAAISVQTSDKTDPVFGTFWAIATVETDRDNRRVIIQSVKVPNVKLSGQADNNLIANLKSLLESQLPEVAGDLPLDELLSQLDMSQEQKKLSKDLNTAPPKILYASRPSILVLIDGRPKFQPNKDWNMDVVVNTPFTIVKNSDGKFYLYGGKRWYSAAAATGPYTAAGNVPENLRKVEQEINEANSSDAGYQDPATAKQDNVVSDIIVSTQRAELIQTNGSANFTSIEGTSLSYASNSGNDIFMDVNTHQYYVLISGRWYTSPSLRDHWQYVASDKLPADFAKIPEGSPKDNVLASVAGTEAAREAVMDAQIPQTAKVDRSTATTNVQYNGDPRFQSIQGTDMQYAVNTSSSVILVRGVYYTVDNGVWFQSEDGPEGPWVVCTDRPEEVDLIPPSSPVYNIKYVYVYDVTPEYVYMGYTPGYLNTFIYGPTIVYGTGFYYDPWFDGFYYARPWTWGFNMCYNPWAGWSIGYGYSFGWFHFGIGYSRPGYWGGGWWGPRIYRPPYVWNHSRTYGYYSNKFYRNRNVRVNNNYTTNIYVNRPGVVTHNNRPFINRPNNRRPATINNTSPNRPVLPNGTSTRPGFNQDRRLPQVQRPQQQQQT
ncbi:MAG TPA: hypothetical protein VJ647_01370, partial [Chitinophagaceae bacterium]|nr:hypothetical protein [Chitinophagaceae bacterium]